MKIHRPVSSVGRRVRASTVCLIILAILVPTAAPAQQPDLAFDLVLGTAVPLGNTDETSSGGLAIGFGIQHRLSGRWALTTDFQYTTFGQDASPASGPGTGTDLDIWRITFGPAVRLTNPGSPWILSVRAGLGLAGIKSGDLPPGSQEPQEPRTGGLDEDVFSLTGGFELSREVGSSFFPFLRMQADTYSLGRSLFGLALLNPAVPVSGSLRGASVVVGVRLEL